MFSARFSPFGMAAAQSNGSPHLVISTIFREGTTATDRVEKSCAQAYRKTNTSLSPLPSPFLRGKGDRLRWMRVDLTLLLSLTIKRTVSPHQALRARSLRGKPCTEPCSERLYRSRQDPSADARDDKDDFYFQRSFSSPITGFPKSIEELFGKRSGRRCGQGGKHSAPSAMAPCQRRAQDDRGTKTPPHGRRIHKQKRPLTGGAFTSKNASPMGGVFFTFFGKFSAADDGAHPGDGVGAVFAAQLQIDGADIIAGGAVG